MDTDSGKESEEKTKISSIIDLLRNAIASIVSKLRSERGRRIIVNHLLPISIFLLISVLIFRNLIGVDGEIVNGDLVRPPDSGRLLHYYYPIWSEYESVTLISRLPQLMFYLPFIEMGLLFGMDTTEILVIIFIFIETLAGLSMYYASRYLLKKTYKNHDQKIIIASFSAGLAYMWSAYLIFQSFHPFMRVAFAFPPYVSAS